MRYRTVFLFAAILFTTLSGCSVEDYVSKSVYDQVLRENELLQQDLVAEREAIRAIYVED
jgi:hypothetical protein